MEYNVFDNVVFAGAPTYPADKEKRQNQISQQVVNNSVNANANANANSNSRKLLQSPTHTPTQPPSFPSQAPTRVPSEAPSQPPTISPSIAPTGTPTTAPTCATIEYVMSNNIASGDEISLGAGYFTLVESYSFTDGFNFSFIGSTKSNTLINIDDDSRFSSSSSSSVFEILNGSNIKFENLTLHMNDDLSRITNGTLFKVDGI